MRGGPPRRPPLLGATVRVLLLLAAVGVAFHFLRPGHGGTSESPAPAAEAALWPNGVVRYYNTATDQQWAVDQAVAAWNSSGASVRFVPAAANDAELTIDDRGPTCLPGAEATVGMVRDATVSLPRLDQANGSCNQYSAAVFAAHELGHVLGLTHQFTGCAAMNTAGSYRGPSQCPRAPPGAWWCTLLEPIDVARAVQLYGGAVRPRPQQYCQLYAPPAAPAGLTASARPGGLEFRFVRPPETTIPPFVAVSPASEATFTSAFSRGTCAESTGPHYRWTVAPGSPMTLSYPASPGTYCFTVRAWDRSGQHGPTASYRIALR